MVILHIEHAVADYDRWKAAFDGDPVGRRTGGVRRYRIARAVDDPDHVVIDLEFDSAGEAEAFLGGLRQLWGRVDVMRDPVARVLEEAESGEY